MPLGKPLSVFSTQLRRLNLPFEAGAESPKESEVPRIVRNQIAVRGAKIIQRPLTAMGTSLMGYSVVIGGQPINPKIPSLSTRQQFNRESRLMQGSSRDMGSASRYEFSKGGPSDRHTRHYQKSSRASNRRRLKVNTLRGAGGVALVGSRVVPVLAYGYVAGQYLQNPFSRTDEVKSPINTEAMLKDLAYVNSISMSQVGMALSTIRTTYHAANILRKQFL